MSHPDDKQFRRMLRRLVALGLAIICAVLLGAWLALS